MITREVDFRTKQGEIHHNTTTSDAMEGDDNSLNKTAFASRPTTTTTSLSSSWTRLKDPRIVRVSRAFGGKDRHSKVCTARGLRDRRVRLSVPTAIQLYDLQDRLGLNQPSKVVDWLLDVAKNDIDQLPPLQFPPQTSIFDHPYLQHPLQPPNNAAAAAAATSANGSVPQPLPFSSFLKWDIPLNHHHHGGAGVASSSVTAKPKDNSFNDNGLLTSSSYHQGLLQQYSFFHHHPHISNGGGVAQPPPQEGIDHHHHLKQMINFQMLMSSGSGSSALRPMHFLHNSQHGGSTEPDDDDKNED